MVTRWSRKGRFVVALAGVALLAMVTSAAARGDAMAACAEQGGTYYEDGHCEVAAESPAHACRRQGGQYVGNGRCEFAPSEREQVESCKRAGGIVMQAGNCYGPARRR